METAGLLLSRWKVTIIPVRSSLSGARPGVGGIIRDIFTMGARLVFLLDSLRFGSIEGNAPAAKNNRRLFFRKWWPAFHITEIVLGFESGGGNSVGTEGNPLVNVLSYAPA